MWITLAVPLWLSRCRASNQCHGRSMNVHFTSLSGSMRTQGAINSYSHAAVLKPQHGHRKLWQALCCAWSTSRVQARSSHYPVPSFRTLPISRYMDAAGQYMLHIALAVRLWACWGVKRLCFCRQHLPVPPCGLAATAQWALPGGRQTCHAGGLAAPAAGQQGRCPHHHLLLLRQQGLRMLEEGLPNP